MHAPVADPVQDFIARWDGTERAERANKDMFLTELCAVLGVKPPDPAAGGLGDYRFERAVTHHATDGTAKPRRIDLYKRGCFVLEAKQGDDARRQGSLFTTEAEHRSKVRGRAGWSRHMLEAKGQAEQYARDLPADEGWPPFLIVCDVGFCLDFYADFTDPYATVGFVDWKFRLYSSFLDKSDLRFVARRRNAARCQLRRLRLSWTYSHRAKSQHFGSKHY